jgi:prepilin-type N-terminal cleavage/methylation domain-containing protein
MRFSREHNQHRKYTAGGFTIVELLIVIVVIALLSVIVVVAFNGVQNNAKASRVQAAVSQAAKKVHLFAVDNFDSYPTNLSDVDVSGDETVTYQYDADNTTNPRSYCLTVTVDTVSYYTGNGQTKPVQGICPQNSVVIWNKLVASSAPIQTEVLDYAEYRVQAPSIRIDPGSSSVAVRTTPLSVSTGDQYRVKFWIKTDPGWNGTGSWSKIRFGSQTNAHLLSCTYLGVKLTWTYTTCDYTVAAGVTGLSIQFGNDSPTGNLWLDDIVISKLN